MEEFVSWPSLFSFLDANRDHCSSLPLRSKQQTNIKTVVDLAAAEPKAGLARHEAHRTQKTSSVVSAKRNHL
jgi:hypothetical protein